MYRVIKISLLLLLIISVQGLFGQTTPDKIPNGIAIQSVARDANGNAASNRNIYLKVELRQGTATGESVLLETHQVTSNDEGIFNFYIGQGTRVSGINSLIFLDWKGKIYFLNIKMAIEPSLPTPGWVLDKEYVDLGTSQIWSVPYAFTSYRSVVADSANSISGILAGANGGTGVSNVGKTITLGRNFEIQGLGNLKFNTVGPTNLTLPLKGTLVTSESLDTLINKYLLSPTFLGSPKTPTPDIKSNDSSVASTQFVKSVINSEINTLNTKLSSTLDTSAGAKLKISDTLVMLSNRFERDTASLSNRINQKVNTLNAKIDSSLYVNGLVKIDSVVTINDSLNVKGQARFDSLLTINDSLRVKGNVLIDTNLTVGKDLEIKGNLILNSGLQFNDSLIVSKGARIEQSILAKSKLYVSDSVLAKGNVKIDNNLNVGKVTSLNDSLYVKGQARFDSLLTINDSLRVKGNVLIDTNLTVGKDLEIKGNLILNSGLQFNDSLIVSKGARIEQSILAKSKLYVSDSVIAKGNVKIDNNLNVGKVTSLNDSLYVKGQARFDSLLTINDSLRVKGNVLIDSNLTVLGRLSLSTALQFNDSLIVSKGARIDQSILAKSKLYVSDSILAKGNVLIDNNLNVTKVTSLNDSLYVKGQARFDSLLTINDSLRVKGNVLIDTNLTVKKVTSLNDSLYVKGQARFDSLLTINDSLRVKGNVLIDTNLTVNKITTLNDSLIVKGGMRVDQNILAKSKLTVTDSLLAKGNVKIDNNLFVKGRNIDDSIMRYTWSKVNVSDTSNMLADYLRKINDLYSSISASNGEIANKLAISDTAFLLQKRDTFTLSNRINLKLNLSDTASMLSNRIQRDTASLSNRIDKLVTGSGDLATTKLNITDTSRLLAKIDTANMLSSRFQRDTAYLSRRLDLLDQATFVNNNLKLNITDTSNLLQKKDTITLSNRIDALAQSSNVFTSDITLNMGAGKTFGKYSNGETIPSRGKSIDDVIKDIVTLVIHPTYTRPTAGLSMGSSGDFEIGTNLGTLTFSPNFTQNDGGNFTAISYKKNGVEIANNAGSPSVTDNVGTLSATTNYQVTYTYGAGTTVKKNNINVDDPVGMITASTVNSGIITLTPRSYRYWGMTTNSSASITDANILAMVGGSKEFSSSKLKSEFTITGPGGAGPVKYAFYAVPSGNSGTITSIKAGGFESIAAFDVITRNFVNAQGYTVSYDIYVQKNSGTDNVTLIIN